MQNILAAVILLATLTCSSVISFAQQDIQYTTPQIRLPLMQTTPTIDGVIHSTEWSAADRMERFARPELLSPQMASFWVGADAQNLYIAVRSETPPGGEILRRANPLPGKTDARPFKDDAIEIYICPNPDAPSAAQRVYQGIFNAKNAIYDQLFSANGGKPWRGDWHIKSSITDEYWDCEIALPWKSIGINGSPLNKTIGLRIGRDWQRSVGSRQTEWSPLGGSYTTVSTMARVTWDAKAPVVQVLQLQNAPGQPVNIQLQIKNPTNTDLKVLSQVNLIPQNSQHTQSKQLVSVAAGKSQKLTIKSAALPNEEIATNIEVTSPDGKKIYYKRNFAWQINRPQIVWKLNKNAVKRIDTRFAYFPSFNAMHVKVDISSMQQRNSVKAVELTIRRKGSTENIAQTTMPPFKNDSSELVRWDIPELGEGEFELVTQLQGVSVKPQVQSFVRHKFPWEGNKLGLSDRVVPPFTPIVVKGNEIGTILRQHQMNGVGLWNQVIADKKPLLKSPMRIEATIDGKVLLARGNLKITSKKATSVTTQSDWQAGALQGSTQNVWDYDGVMKSTFTLQPTSKKIDSLSLIIPLDSAQMPLMHTCTDGIRFNYAGKVPAGQGVIWDSTEAAHRSIIGNYVPYIWIGGQKRGVAVFGDNDAGWITNDKVPCQQIVRKADGTLELRLNLVQVPSTWKKPRTIVIGFQATPVKPMPKNWRLWTVRGQGNVKALGQYHQGLYGSSYYWGAVTPFRDIYPRDHDFRIFDEFAKTRKTSVVPKEFIKEWLKGYKLPEGEKGKKKLDIYTRHINAAFNVVARHPDGMLIYTNGRGVRYDTPEGQTFLNEWNRNSFPQRQWSYGSGVGYGVDPVASYRDYTAWYWKKMLTTFDDGIYWDNVFLQSNFNPIDSNAYLRPDGQVQPSATLWNMRALVRRGAILADELGMKNRNMVHMTNTAIAPILSFARTQLSWEDQTGSKDFQDRFPRDYIQAESIGRQFGNVPIVLTLSHIRTSGPNAKGDKNWANRTAAGVMLTHEIKPRLSQTNDDPFFDNYDRLVAFGYGQPNVKVYNYWQKTYPAQISGDTSSLLVSKPQHAMIVVCDWGGGGDITVQLDTKVLSLKGAIKATNLETGEAIPVTGNTLKMNLKKHDFALIQIEEK